MPHLRDAGEGSGGVLGNHWSERLGARGREGLSKRWRHLAYYTLRYKVPLVLFGRFEFDFEAQRLHTKLGSASGWQPR